MTSVLPVNSTPLEVALDEAGDARFETLYPGADAIAGWRWTCPRASLFPWLIWEYGLGAMSPYLPTLSCAVYYGVAWERLRGTHAAVARGLEFIDYDGTIIDPPARRTAWADFQIALGRVRDAEADLPRIAGVIDLSRPARSRLRRGYAAYDVPAAELSWTRLGRSIIGDDSGVRPDAAGPKWSFGRDHEAEATLTEAELTGLGVWIPGGTDPVTWEDLTFPWTDIVGAWTDLGSDTARRATMASALAARGAYIALYDAEGEMIGARRCRACRPVAFGDTYEIAGGTWSPDVAGTRLYIEARTGWGDGSGQTAVEAAVLFGAAPADTSRPGQLWCAPSEISAPYAAVARHAVSIPLGDTVRDRVALLADFT
ncbi:phage tail protein [Breoghania sp. JC706]|uniref:phage tail protein n=1 Tax=Breoghania sp. JC706 TaxID=3117732 RepID=UPI00300A92E5